MITQWISFLVLADLEAFWQVGIEVILSVEDAMHGDLAVQSKRRL